MKYFILIFLLLFLFIHLKIIEKYENFKKYDFLNSLNESKETDLVGRINKIRLKNFYRRNSLPDTSEVDILKEDLEHFIDNDLNKLQKKIILNKKHR